VRCAVDQRECVPDGRKCRRFPGEQASCGCAYRIEDRWQCPLDGQPCAGDECMEWDSPECQERRQAHAASVRVIVEQAGRGKG
jgi:hypothetical protein